MYLLVVRMNNLKKKLYICTIERYSSATKKCKDFLPEDQLQTRFLKYLVESEKQERPLPPPSFNDDSANRESSTLSRSYDRAIRSMDLLKRRERNKTNASTNISLKIVDKDCCNLLRFLSHSQTLQLLRLLALAKPSHVKTTKFYKYAIENLTKRLIARELTLRETLNLLFISSFGKKLATRNVALIINHLPPLEDLKLIEQCIVALSSFKCGIKLKAENAGILETVIEREAFALVSDPALLVTLCKAVRYAGPTNNCLFSSLSVALVKNSEFRSLRRRALKTVAHTLSLYAEAKVRCSDVLEKLVEDTTEALFDAAVNTTQPNDVRDFDRLLWALSTLNYQLKPSERDATSAFFEARQKDFAKNSFLLATTLLYLWMLDYRSKELIQESFDKRVFQTIIENERRWKSLARLKLLVSCVKTEMPEVRLNEELTKLPSVGIKVRKTVKFLYGSLCRDESFANLDLSHLTIDCPIEGLYIPGVTFRSRQIVCHVDVLDSEICLKEPKTTTDLMPHGLASLKLRLLPKMNYRSILVTASELNEPGSVRSTIERCLRRDQEDRGFINGDSLIGATNK